RLVAAGTRELVLVAQDYTAYGHDLTGGMGLGGLLRRLSDIDDDIWIRVLYGHPESIDDDIIRTMAERPNICPYFDLPIQHASDRVLRRMGRRHTQADLFHLFERIREFAPQASLRTTVIVGFPGETDQDFKTLQSFVETVRFDHLGVFTYSDADDLPSHRLDAHVSRKTARKRHDRLMSRQRDISTEKNAAYLDRTLDVLIEESPEADLFLGRTAFQAPEVDGLVYVKGRELPLGRFAPVTIIDTLEYDLVGEAR
ncbi:MAG: radical SAM protein, partial [Desulfococcus multivorans]|nr:radical SAM protein [Desulfococcus multivorans]